MRPIEQVLDSLYCCVRELEIIIGEYEKFVENLGMKPLAEMGISDKVKIAEFIKTIRIDHNLESDLTD